jgi:hypothetical protein
MRESAMTLPPKLARIAKRVATHLWSADGKPECGGLGTVGRHSYEMWATDVVRALHELGYDPSKKGATHDRE